MFKFCGNLFQSAKIAIVAERAGGELAGTAPVYFATRRSEVRGVSPTGKSFRSCVRTRGVYV